jgi:hypothetical protein
MRAAREVFMKKLILLAVLAVTIIAGFALRAGAQTEETCNCGYDEDGECLPCEE